MFTRWYPAPRKYTAIKIIRYEGHVVKGLFLRKMSIYYLMGDFSVRPNTDEESQQSFLSQYSRAMSTTAEH